MINIYKTLIRVLLLGILATILYSCDRNNEYAIENDPVLNFDTKFKNESVFPYSKNINAQERLIDGYKKLLLGMHQKEVLYNMGPPDIKDSVYALNNKSFTTSSWLYILDMDAPLTDSNHNIRAIALYFDSENNLVAALPKDVSDLNSVGSVKNSHQGLRYQLYW